MQGLSDMIALLIFAPFLACIGCFWVAVCEDRDRSKYFQWLKVIGLLK